MFVLLAQTIAARRLVARNTSQLADWTRAHDDLAQKLHRGELAGPRWMRSVDEPPSHVELDELLRAIDFAKLAGVPLYERRRHEASCTRAFRSGRRPRTRI